MWRESLITDLVAQRNPDLRIADQLPSRDLWLSD